jgi:hypothetical protein
MLSSTAHSSKPAHTTSATAKELTEDITENVFQVHRGNIGPGRSTPDSSFSELVITLAGLAIRQNLVSMCNALELLLCPRLLINIWMVLPSQFAKG